MIKTRPISSTQSHASGNATHWSELRIVAAIALATLVTRFPYIFEYVIDWDESTYVLLAQSMLNGNLLYEGLWDSKPPVGLSIYAAAIELFGRSIISIRLVGLACVGISAWQVYRLVVGLAGQRTAALAAVLFIVGLTAIESAQATMLEIVSLPFLLGATLLLRHPAVTNGQVIWSGAMIAAATLTRTNLGIVAPLLGALVVVRGLQAGGRRILTLPLFFGAGGLFVLAIAAAPHLVAGRLDLFMFTIFETPGRRSAELLSTSRAWIRPLRLMLGLRGGWSPHNAEAALALLVWLPALLTVIKLAAQRVLSSEWRPSMPPSFTVMTMGVVLSIGMTGKPWAHHLIQLLPFAAVLASLSIAPLLSGRWRLPGRVAVSVLCLATAQSVPSQYRRLAENWSHGQVMLGPMADLLRFLNGQCGTDCRLFLMTDHMAYWLLDKPVPTRIAHPSNLDEGQFYAPAVVVAANPAAEFDAVLSTQPMFIVVPRDLKWLDDAQALQSFRTAIESDYRLAYTYAGGSVYELTAPVHPSARELAKKRSYR